MQHTQAEVTGITALSDFVYKLELTPAKAVHFKAGQYLQVIMSAGDKRPFSIASTPENTHYIELHIGAGEDNPYAFEVLQKARNTGQFELEVGLGDAYARENELPAILIAGGTGYSYTKSILFHLMDAQPTRQISLYWGVRKLSDLYEHDQLSAMDKLYPNFRYIPVIQDDTAWTGKTGLVHEVVLSDFENFAHTEVYTAGRFEMAAIIRDTFTRQGLPISHLYGDAFAFI